LEKIFQKREKNSNCGIFMQSAKIPQQQFFFLCAIGVTEYKMHVKCCILVFELKLNAFTNIPLMKNLTGTYQ
jgi:hypothetical protein